MEVVMRRLTGWVALACMAACFAGPALARGLREDRKSSDMARDAPPARNASDFPQQLVVDGRVIGQRIESREGEICLVCGNPISSHDVTYLVQGQRVPLHKKNCFGIFSAQPLRWLAKLKPHGAFLDASAAKVGLSANWFLFGLYVLVGLLFGALAAHRALHVGRNPLVWLGVGILANLPGYLALLMLPKQSVNAPAGIPGGLGKIAATYAPENCPACGWENHPSASKCGNCGASLAPKTVSEVAQAGLRSD